MRHATTLAAAILTLTLLPSPGSALDLGESVEKARRAVAEAQARSLARELAELAAKGESLGGEDKLSRRELVRLLELRARMGGPFDAPLTATEARELAELIVRGRELGGAERLSQGDQARLAALQRRMSR